MKMHTTGEVPNKLSAAETREIVRKDQVKVAHPRLADCGAGDYRLRMNMTEIQVHGWGTEIGGIAKETLQRMEVDEDYIYESEEEDEHLEYHESEWTDNRIPRKKWTTEKVGNTMYKFYNRGNGTLDFDAPDVGYPACPKLKDINIIGHPNFPNQPSLKTGKGDNSQHFWAANDIAKTKGERGKGTSPTKLTWHHHKDPGRMQLLDRKVHGKFKHCGGKAIWGTQ